MFRQVAEIQVIEQLAATAPAATPAKLAATGGAADMDIDEQENALLGGVEPSKPVVDERVAPKPGRLSKFQRKSKAARKKRKRIIQAHRAARARHVPPALFKRAWEDMVEARRKISEAMGLFKYYRYGP